MSGATKSRGAEARRDVEPGDTVLRVPASIVMTVERARRELGAEFDAALASDDAATLAVYLATEKAKGERSFWEPYIAAIEATTTSPHANVLDWTETMFDELQDRGEIMREAHARVQMLQREHRRVAEKRPWISFAEYKWSSFVVSSRAFGRRLDALALVPLADALNHGNVQTKYELKDGYFRLWTCGSYAVPRGAEILNSYGRHANRHLLMEYGFCLLQNPWDFVVVSLSVEGVVPDHLMDALRGGEAEAAARLDEELVPRKAALLERAKFKSQITLFGRDQIPEQLLRFYRIALSTRAELEELERDAPHAAGLVVISLANEDAALTAAEVGLEGVLRSMPTTEAADLVALNVAAAKAAWLVTAIRYRLGRKRVLRLNKRFVEGLRRFVRAAGDIGWDADTLRRVYDKVTGHVADEVWSSSGGSPNGGGGGGGGRGSATGGATDADDDDAVAGVEEMLLRWRVSLQ